MDLYRDTYALIDLDNIKNNVSKIINKYNNYEYYFGVVKADCYGHYDAVKSIIDGGCNYLAVALLEEALKIRKNFLDIPILCLGIIPVKYLDKCCDNNITITVNSLEYAKDIVENNYSNLKVHVKINSGMNRLGVSSKDDFNEIVKLFKDNNIFIEGVYTHIYNSSNSVDTEEQFEKYKCITSDINKEDISIFHLAASDTIVNYKKLDFVNGCRLGIMMYGFTSDKSLDLESTFSLYSKVIQINTIKKGNKVGYDGNYIAESDYEKIGVVCIGYADGVIRENSGRYVYINNKRYPIVGNICMDMLFVKIDDSVKVGDSVLIFKDINHIEEVSKYLNTISYEVICCVGHRVPRIYK